MKYIDLFEGQYDFLSNFYHIAIVFEGEEYPTLEHAYQAAKTFNPELRLKIRMAVTPTEAKRIGHEIQHRLDWEQKKFQIMKELLMQKFRDRKLRRRLLGTNSAELIEGNSWGDVTWGCIRENNKWVGENMLGKLLMEIRDRIIEEDS